MCALIKRVRLRLRLRATSTQSANSIHDCASVSHPSHRVVGPSVRGFPRHGEPEIQGMRVVLVVESRLVHRIRHRRRGIHERKMRVIRSIHPSKQSINQSARERLTFTFARAVDSRGRGRAERRRGKVRRTFRFRFRRLFRGNKVCRDATRVQQTARLTDAFVVARLDSIRFETQVRTG